MKLKPRYILIATALLIVAGTWFGMAKVAAYQNQKPKSFEYMVIETKDGRVLNKFGAEGWELHSVVYDGNGVFCYLKRSN